ncbi:MAG: hypothetical protein FD156_1186 [Nitrospirae bacterium]|nr:MAG: hypothetical protein FD156_1186 [Nitrospirota bacterium]
MTAILNNRPRKKETESLRNREKIWKVIRVLREFSVEEVSTLTELIYKVVSGYVFHLYNAGYVRQAGKRKEGDGRNRVLWRIAKNTGPKAPVICRCLYDPNIDNLMQLKDDKPSLNNPPQPSLKLRESERDGKKVFHPIGGGLLERMGRRRKHVD